MSKTTFHIIIASVLLVAFIFMTFLMCSNPTTAEADTTMGFEVIERDIHHVKIVYDIETGVMYTMSTAYNNIGSMTLMVNPDGTPRVYEGFSGK